MGRAKRERSALCCGWSKSHLTEDLSLCMQPREKTCFSASWLKLHLCLIKQRKRIKRGATCNGFLPTFWKHTYAPAGSSGDLRDPWPCPDCYQTAQMQASSDNRTVATETPITTSLALFFPLFLPCLWASLRSRSPFLWGLRHVGSHAHTALTKAGQYQHGPGG